MLSGSFLSMNVSESSESQKNDKTEDQVESIPSFEIGIESKPNPTVVEAFSVSWKKMKKETKMQHKNYINFWAHYFTCTDLQEQAIVFLIESPTYLVIFEIFLLWNPDYNRKS